VVCSNGEFPLWFYALTYQAGPKGADKPKKAAVDTSAEDKKFKSEHKHLFVKRPKSFHIGGDLRKVKDLGRFVRWPRYIRLQRQRAVLKRRLKNPPAINQFIARALNAQQSNVIFSLLKKYEPETSKQKKERILARMAALESGAKEDPTAKPKILKFGLNHITHLVEKAKAKLVVIAHDVDPIEIICWLPALCRAMNVPYVIVKGKARLGQLVHQKTASVVALTDIRKEDQATLDQIITNFRPQFNDLPTSERRKWGPIVLGVKSVAKLEKIRRAKAKEVKFSQ